MSVASKKEWIEYVEANLLLVCGKKDWLYSRFTEGSPIGPFGTPAAGYLAWQLLPWSSNNGPVNYRLQEPVSWLEETAHYVVDFNHAHGIFRLWHSNVWSGAFKSSHSQLTATEIPAVCTSDETPSEGWWWGQPWMTCVGKPVPTHLPPDRWLSKHILELVERFRPNSFSY